MRDGQLVARALARRDMREDGAETLGSHDDEDEWVLRREKDGYCVGRMERELKCSVAAIAGKVAVGTCICNEPWSRGRGLDVGTRATARGQPGRCHGQRATAIRAEQSPTLVETSSQWHRN